MIFSVLLGLILLAFLLWVGRWFVTAEPKTVIAVGRILIIVLVVGAVLLFVARAPIGFLLALATALVPLIPLVGRAVRHAKNNRRMASGGSGQRSVVETRYFRMTLDHDSGDLDGVVREGLHTGRRLGTLSIEQLANLWHQVAGGDLDSERVLAAYLDRRHEGWRDDSMFLVGENENDQADDAAPSTSAGQMSRQEALHILGLEEGCSDEEIKAAYHRLIRNVHPDHGGSAFLASQVNRARDTLLGS